MAEECVQEPRATNVALGCTFDGIDVRGLVKVNMRITRMAIYDC